jgi:hypothetical protein
MVGSSAGGGSGVFGVIGKVTQVDHPSEAAERCAGTVVVADRGECLTLCR